MCLTLVIRWTVAGRTPLSMGCSRQEYCRGCPSSPFKTVPAMTIVSQSGRGLALASVEELCRFSPHLGQSSHWALGDLGQAYSEASTPSSRAVLPLGFKFCYLFTTMTANYIERIFFFIYGICYTPGMHFLPSFFSGSANFPKNSFVSSLVGLIKQSKTRHRLMSHPGPPLSMPFHWGKSLWGQWSKPT